MKQEINKWVHDKSHYDVYSNKIELAVETQKAIVRKFLPRVIDGDPSKGDMIVINRIRLWTISESLTQSTR
jgi:hypothetical protein